MSVKKAMRIWLASVLSAGLALGEGVAPGNGQDPGDADPVSVAGSQAPPPPAADLDFGEDFPAPNRTHPARAPADPGARVTKTLPRAAPRKPSHAWAWWTAGLAALTAGGAAWYLHYGAGSPPDPVIVNQDFSDAAD